MPLASRTLRTVLGEKLALPFPLWPFRAPMHPPGAGPWPRGRLRRTHLLLPPHSVPSSFPKGLWGRSVLATNSGLGPDIILLWPRRKAPRFSHKTFCAGLRSKSFKPSKVGCQVSGAGISQWVLSPWIHRNLKAARQEYVEKFHGPSWVLLARGPIGSGRKQK